MQAKGKCLCGSVKFSFDVQEKHFGACHCKMCRNWGGSMAFAVQAAGNIKLEGEENITLFDSSEWAQRGFCNKCGSHLFYKMKQGDFCNFQLGVIEGHEEYTFTNQVYIDAKPENYSFIQKTHTMTEKEVLEAFGV